MYGQNKIVPLMEFFYYKKWVQAKWKKKMQKKF